MSFRTAQQKSRTPQQWADFKADERRRNLEACLRELGKARRARAPWYVWVTEVWPVKGGA